LSNPDLLLIATTLLSRLPHEYIQSLAVRHKLSGGEKRSGSPNYASLLSAHLKTLDDTGLSRLLVEASLLEAATNTYTRAAVEPLEAIAKRYRVNTAKIAESVAAEFSAKQRKQDERRRSVTPGAEKSKAKSVKRKS